MGEFLFGGHPGDSVEQVDPEDLKAVWAIQHELEMRHPGEQVATGLTVLQQACKPGENLVRSFTVVPCSSSSSHMSRNLHLG
jgi:hypothetical protein